MNGVKLQSASGVKIGNGLTKLTRKRHVIPPRQTPGRFSFFCKFVAHRS